MSGSGTIPPTKRYRMPGIEHEGIAQLSLLETALWPLQGGKILTPTFETTYGFSSSAGRQTARVTVRSALGLRPFDEYVLWGLLGATLGRKGADTVLLATPYWLLRHLGLQTGGTQYAQLRDSLLRLATTSYQNTGFFNPVSQEREFVAFQFLSMMLPTVGGRGESVDNDRCWRIIWNETFYRLSNVTGGNLLFDLDLFQKLTPVSRRLFLKLKDRFWREERAFYNVEDLTINGLGFAASRPLKKRKYDLTLCLRELLDYGIIELGRGQTDPKGLFLKRGKGSYVVVLFKGEYFRKPLSRRVVREKNAIADDPLYDPLRKIGVDEAGIRRLFKDYSRGQLQQWIRVTDAAMHERPRGFPGFNVSPAAFLIDGIQNNRTPPDWIHAHEKKLEADQWQRDKIAFAEEEQNLLIRYGRERATALQQYLATAEGRGKYEQTYQMLLELYKRTEPLRFHDATHDAAIARIEKTDLHFPDFEVWIASPQTQDSNLAA